MKNTNSDSFAYVMTFHRYIFEKFYEVMIDSSASTKSIVEYDQYLAFKNHKIDSFIDLNHTRAETVNVQFDIESASSIESLIIDSVIVGLNSNTFFQLDPIRRTRSKTQF
jgi:hypothetical protein